MAEIQTDREKGGREHEKMRDIERKRQIQEWIERESETNIEKWANTDLRRERERERDTERDRDRDGEPERDRE